MKSVWKKIGRIAGIAIASVLALVLLVYAGLWVARLIVYNDYVCNKETVCKIPALGDGFVPQGLTDIDGETYILTGYMGETHELAIYLANDKSEKELIPVDKDGKRISGHGGGAARAGDLVYIANEAGEVLIFRLSDLLSTPNGGKVKPASSFKSLTNASFCFADGNHLYVGEFYRPVDYETKPEHAYVTPAGDSHHAWVCRYPLDDKGAIITTTPDQVISVTDQVQGFAVKGDVYMLSRSWGVSSSKLDCYMGLTDSGTKVTIGTVEVPLFYLDSTNHQKTVNMPAFSEDLTVVGDRVVISFESACNKYVIGKFFFANKLVSYPIPS